MNLETIQSMWETDSQIDQFKIHDEAAKIPMLHAKYWDVYNALKLLKYVKTGWLTPRQVVVTML